MMRNRRSVLAFPAVRWALGAAALGISISIGLLLFGVGATAKMQTTKADYAAAAQARIDTSRALGRGPKPASVPVVHQAPPVRQAGIIQMRQGPFSATVFAVNDFWQGPVGSDWALVYAGASRAASGGEIGALRVYTETATSDGGFSLQLVGTYSDGPSTSPLTVIAWHGEVLTIQRTDGSQVSFNLATHTFS